MRRDLAILSATAALIFPACSQPDAPLGATNEFHVSLDVQPTPIDKLDILFVVDDSGSMADQQGRLMQSAGDDLFAQLATPEGGLPDLHIAVITTDMGAGSVSGCDPSQSKRGLFQRAAECGVTDPYLTNDNHTGMIADAFACMADVGTTGCGFERHLDAIKAALDGTNPENAGFLRDDAMLLVAILSDEDDCSAFDDHVFDTSQNSLDSELGPLESFRCFEFGVVCDPDDPRTAGDKGNCVSREDSPYMSPVAPYVDFLRNLKSDPSMVMVAGIFGDAGPVSVGDDPNNPSHPELTNLCPDTADAYAAVRLNQFAASFPARFTFAPICAASMSPGLQSIAHQVSGVMSGDPCLQGELAAHPTCRAFARTPGGASRALSDPILTPDATTCSYTPSHLAAHVDAALTDGEHLVVECR
jgi:hypothetical protein